MGFLTTSAPREQGPNTGVPSRFEIAGTIEIAGTLVGICMYLASQPYNHGLLLEKLLESKDAPPQLPCVRAV